jgi:hypothetical protein
VILATDLREYIVILEIDNCGNWSLACEGEQRCNSTAELTYHWQLCVYFDISYINRVRDSKIMKKW